MLFPLSALQNWPTPNYANPERRGPAATIIVSVLLGLVTLILNVRIYTRVRISRGFGLDDVLIIFAYVWLLSIDTIFLSEPRLTSIYRYLRRPLLCSRSLLCGNSAGELTFGMFQ